jgi:serine/threonine-protein kinase
LTDFGIAKAEDRIQTTRTHEVKGKLAYLAPERVDRRRLCTVQSDVFSMAVVLWECFAGRRLFRGEEAVDVLQEVMTGYIPTLAEIGAQLPGALDDVISRALSRDLEVRYATAADFAKAIDAAVGSDHVGTHSDVARLMEAIFGARMAARQEQVREAIGSADLASLLREAGLPSREPMSRDELPTGQLLAELAPPAPTERYALAAGIPKRARGRSRRAAWWTAGGVAAGIAIGAALTLTIVSRRARPNPIVVHGTALPQASATELPAVTWSRVDVEGRVDVEPAEPPEATMTNDPPHQGQRPRLRAPRPIGTVHDGFTKLR